MTVYTRKNGYGDIDTNAPHFQVGNRLYIAQKLLAKIEQARDEKLNLSGMNITSEDVKRLAEWYCELVAWVGQLRADYDAMRQVVEGKAEFREE